MRLDLIKLHHQRIYGVLREFLSCCGFSLRFSGFHRRVESSCTECRSSMAGSDGISRFSPVFALRRIIGTLYTVSRVLSSTAEGQALDG